MPLPPTAAGPGRSNTAASGERPRPGQEDNFRGPDDAIEVVSYCDCDIQLEIDNQQILWKT